MLLFELYLNQYETLRTAYGSFEHPSCEFLSRNVLQLSAKTHGWHSQKAASGVVESIPRNLNVVVGLFISR